MYKTLIKPFLQDVKGFVVDTLFPIRCVICEQEGKEFLCIFCKSQLTPLASQICIVCKNDSPFGNTHFGCQTPHAADGLISFLDYRDEKVSKLIISGKYYFLPSVYEILGKMMAEKLKSSYPELLKSNIFYLVPVPLHSFRKRWRGFNQAEILTNVLSENLSTEILDVLTRKKSTSTQKDLKREARIKNMEGAFKLKEKVDIHGKNFIVIDDVTTTGSTLLEAVKVLKRNGANQVWCLTVARD